MASCVVKRAALAVTLASAALSSAPYTLDAADIYQGNSFFDKFSFSEEADLSHGWVNYVSHARASSSKLVSNYADGSVYVGVDTTTSGGKRASVRLESNALYTHGLFIIDVVHMPGSICGLWPAFWTTNKSNWPEHGEIDIIENIHENTVSMSTFHTSNSRSIACQVTGNKKGIQQTGTQTTYNCNDHSTFSNYGSQYSGQGCSATNTDPNSYGTTFNAVGGGVYAMEWTNTSIKVWNWERGNIPADITLGLPTPDTWGLPVTFTNTSTCAIEKAFSQHQIIINTNFCGDWGNQSSQWQQTSCYKNNPTTYASCEVYVAANPQAYTEAYWRINSLKVYKQNSVSGGAFINSISDTTTSPSIHSMTFASSTTTTTAAEISSSSTSASVQISATLGSVSASSSEIVKSSTRASTPGLSDTPTSIAPSLMSTMVLSLPSPDSSLSAGIVLSASTTPGAMTLTVEPPTTGTTSFTLSPLTSAETLAPTTRPIPTLEPSLTTSTVLTTVTGTITSCAAAVTDCRVGEITTQTIILSTTVCPVTPTQSIPIFPAPTDSTTVFSTSLSISIFPAPTDSTTIFDVFDTPTPPQSVQLITMSTIFTTIVSTILSCAPTVSNCPVGSVTTKTTSLSTTVYPVSSPPSTQTVLLLRTSTIITTATFTIPSCHPSVTKCPIGSVTLTLSSPPVLALPSSTNIIQPSSIVSLGVMTSAKNTAIQTPSSNPIPTMATSNFGIYSAKGNSTAARSQSPSASAPTTSKSPAPFKGGASRRTASSGLGLIVLGLGAVFLL